MKRSLPRSMVAGSTLSLARLASGVVRVKVLALALGVEGVGIYAILLQLYLTGVAAVSMSLAVPIINLGRPKLAAGDLAGTGDVAGTALAVVGANVLVLFLLSAAFGQPLLDQLGLGQEASGLVWPIAAAIAFGAISGAFWEGMSYVTDRFDIFIRAGILGAVADMLLVGGGAALFGLTGAVLGMTVASAVLFASYAVQILRDPDARDVLRKLSARLSLLPQLFAYSAMMFATVAATNAGLTFLRARVLAEAGAAANGHLQVATSLASYLLAFVMLGFWGHLYPLAAAKGDTPDVRHELSRSLALGLLISFTGCGAAAVLAPIIIPLFYSHEFAGAAGLLVAYLPGELCFQLFSMLVAYQLTVSRRRLYLGLNLTYVALLLLSGMALIPSFGPVGYVAAHVAASFVAVIAAMWIASSRGQVEASLVARAFGMIFLLAAVAAALLYGRGSGYTTVGLLPLLLPFAIGGSLALYRLWQEWGHRGDPATDSNRSISRGAWESSE